jgi:hypothetical protein
VGYFFIGKQKVVLFLKYRENSWESAASALRMNECMFKIFFFFFLFIIKKNVQKKFFKNKT